ncbi:MAG: DnaJ domain-containing protein [Synergistaceae bacterium]|jgi:hypothetical protein|nr:DnaJ domain-containing protein [Synergistaceae bacterium]
MAGEKKSYYEILGVDPRISPRDLKNHFRKIIKQYHPDLHPGEGFEEQYRSVLEAYDVLSTPAKRFDYDHTHGFAANSPIYDASVHSEPQSVSHEKQTPPPPQPPKKAAEPMDPQELFRRIREAQKQKAESYTMKDYLLREKLIGTVFLCCLAIAVFSTISEMFLASAARVPSPFRVISQFGFTSGLLTLGLWIVFFILRFMMMNARRKPGKAFFWMYALFSAMICVFLLKWLNGGNDYGSGLLNFLLDAGIFWVLFAWSSSTLEMDRDIR